MDELDRVSELLPEQQPPSEEDRSRARARLMQEIHRRPGLRGRPRLATAAVSIAVSIAVAVLLTVPTLLGDALHDPPNVAATDRADSESASSRARAKAELLAAASRQQERAPAPDGARWWTRLERISEFRVGQDESYTVERRTTLETWAAAWPSGSLDNPWLLVGVRDVAKPLNDSDWREWRRDGEPQGWKLPTEPQPSSVPVKQPVPDSRTGKGFRLSGGGAVSYQDLLALPSQPDALRARLLQLRRPGGTEMSANEWLVRAAVPILTRVPASAAVRSATLEVLADLPHVRSEGRVEDARGRSGVAIGFGSTGLTLVIDPESGALLATTDGTAPGTPETVYESGRWTTEKPTPH